MRNFSLFVGLSSLFYGFQVGLIPFIPKSYRELISIGVALLIAGLFVWRGSIGKRSVPSTWVWIGFGVSGLLLLYPALDFVFFGPLSGLYYFLYPVLNHPGTRAFVCLILIFLFFKLVIGFGAVTKDINHTVNLSKLTNSRSVAFGELFYMLGSGKGLFRLLLAIAFFVNIPLHNSSAKTLQLMSFMDSKWVQVWSTWLDWPVSMLIALVFLKQIGGVRIFQKMPEHIPGWSLLNLALIGFIIASTVVMVGTYAVKLFEGALLLNLSIVFFGGFSFFLYRNRGSDKAFFVGVMLVLICVLVPMWIGILAEYHLKSLNSFMDSSSQQIVGLLILFATLSLLAAPIIVLAKVLLGIGVCRLLFNYDLNGESQADIAVRPVSLMGNYTYKQTVKVEKYSIEPSNKVDVLQQLRESIQKNPTNIELHDKYHQLLSEDMSQSDAFLSHARVYLTVLIRQRLQSKALQVLKYCFEIDPLFKPRAEEVVPLAKAALVSNEFILALRLMDKFDRSNPEHSAISTIYYLSAKALIGLKHLQQAEKVLNALITRYPNDPMVNEAIKMRDSITG